MIEFRWLITERTETSWDDRWDEEKVSVLRSNPKLQYRYDPRHPWFDIPTVIQKVK